MSKEDVIKVMVVAPNKARPTLLEIKNELNEMQKIVGGYIERVIYEGFDLFCNEEGKLEGLPLNRPLYDSDGKMVEIIAGQFFISAADSEGNQRSLTDEEIEKATNLFTFTHTSLHRFVNDLQAMGIQVELG